MDIGSLTGQIAIEDQLSGVLTNIASQVAQFAKDFDGAMGAAAVGAGVVVAAVAGVTAAIAALGSRGADVNDLKETIDEFTGSVEASAAVMEGLRKGTRNTVDDFALMGFGAKVLQANVKLTAEQFESLGQAAFVMANRGLGSITENLGSLSQALITGRTRGLAMKLGVIETKDATEEYAKSIGKTKSELNDYENAEAKRFAVMQLVNTVTKSNASIQDDFNDRISQATVKVKNFLDELASAVDDSPVVAGAMNGIGEAIMMAFGGNSQQAIKTVVGAINQFAVYIVDAGIATVEATRVMHVGWSLIETVVLGVTTVIVGALAAIVHLGSGVDQLVAKMKPWDQEAQNAAAQSKVLAAEWDAMTGSLADQTAEAAKGVIGQSAFDKKLDEVGGSLMNTRDAMIKAKSAAADHTVQTGKLTGALDKQGGALDRVSKEQVKANQAYRAFKNDVGIREMEDYGKAAEATAKQIEDNVELEFEMNKFYVKNAAALGAYAGNVGLFTQQWINAERIAPATIAHISDGLEGWKNPLHDVAELLQGITNDFAEMMVVASRAIDKIAEVWNDPNMKSGKKFSAIATVGLGAAASIAGNNRTGQTLSGAASGAALGSFAGPVGTAVGAGVGALIGFFKGRSEKRKVDEMRQGLIDLAGGWGALNEAAHTAGTTLTRVLDARNVKEYESAVDELNAKIQFQDDAMQLLDETVKKYGFSIEELGPKFSQQKLNEQAGTLLQDYEVLTAAAIDHNAILDKMAPSMYDYIQSVIAAGGTIPQQLQGPIEEMDKLGLLVDQAGENMVDVSKLTFAETLDQKFSSLIDTIKLLTEAIGRGLGTAIQNIPIPRAINIPVNFDIGPLPDLSQYSGGGEERHYATGGEPRSVDTIQAWVSKGERILNPTENREYESGGDMETKKLLAEIARYQEDMPRITARLVREAVQNTRVR